MAQILATVKVISDLKAYTSFSPGTASNPATGDDVTIILQGYNTPGDGGGGTFVWKRYSDMFYGNPTYTPTPLSLYHDGGIFIDSNNTTTFKPIGIWVRQFSGYIDVRFYGASGGGADWTDEIQKAIDHAARSLENPMYRQFGHTTSNTVFIPNGEYNVSQLIIKSGVTLMGASMQNTTIKSFDDDNYSLIRMPSGIVRDVHVMNLTFYGNAATYNYTTPKNKSCFYFNAVDLNGNGGGLWESSFKNVAIRKFTGHSFYFEGGTTPNYYKLVNQFITMEGVNVESVGELVIGHSTFNNNYHALELKGLNGQFAFNNCRFDGGSYLFATDPPYRVNGIVVYIGTSTTGINPAMINFNTCSIQNGEVGLHIESSNNVNVNGCWFEFFERAIVVRGEYRISKAINIQGSSFLDSAGKYGDKPLGSGRIITIQNAQVNAQNNYVIDSSNSAEASHFIYVDPITIGGVTSKPNLGATANGNYFENKKLGDTVGLKKDLNVDNLIPANVIDIEGAKAIYLKNTSGSTKTIKEIISSVAAGELIFLRADQGNVVLDETKNLYLGNKVTLPMNAGDVALFVKIDQPIGALSYQYNLIAFLPKI